MNKIFENSNYQYDIVITTEIKHLELSTYDFI